MQRLEQFSADLELFWKRTLTEAGATPLDAQIERIEEHLPYQRFRLTYRSLGGVSIRAYLNRPASGERQRRFFPAIVIAPGYGGWSFGESPSECQRGYIMLQVYPRGQGESGELWKVDPGCYQAWINHGKHDREKFYYRGGYMDLVRGIDYLLTRPDVDPERIGLMGTSQAGGIVLAVGAIDQRVKAVVSHVPYLCDFRHNPAFAQLDLAGDPLFLQTFDSFDPVNLAPWLRAPTLVSSGGQDTTCPPETIRAVFDRLPGIKSSAHYPDLAHAQTIDFYEMGWEWMKRYLKQG